MNVHFDLYSDWYKDIYGMRPDCGEYRDAIQYMIDYGESECDYVDISSLSEDEKDFKDYDDYDEYEEEKDDDDTLDNVTLNGEPITDKEVKERLLNEQEQELSDFYDDLLDVRDDDYEEYLH